MSIRRSVALELAGIGAAALLFLATFQVRPPVVDFALAATVVALIALSAKRSVALWATDERHGGPHRKSDAWVASAAVTAAGLVALAALGVLVGDRALLGGELAPLRERLENWHIVIAIALYFPWALLQQYIFQHYLLARLLQLVRPPLAVALTAAAFSSVHFPRWPVMAVVLIAGAVWSLIYRRWRALLPLACSHAVLGAALHYWVFGRDLLERWLP